MKVESNSIPSLNPKQTEGQSSIDKAALYAANQSSTTGETSAKKDVASLSEQARLLAMMAKARSKLNQTPEVRQDLVDDIKRQVDSGSYQIPIEQLAEALLRQMRI